MACCAVRSCVPSTGSKRTQSALCWCRSPDLFVWLFSCRRLGKTMLGCLLNTNPCVVRKRILKNTHGLFLEPHLWLVFLCRLCVQLWSCLTSWWKWRKWYFEVGGSNRAQMLVMWISIWQFENWVGFLLSFFSFFLLDERYFKIRCFRTGWIHYRWRGSTLVNWAFPQSGTNTIC